MKDIFKQFELLNKTDIADPAWVESTRNDLLKLTRYQADVPQTELTSAPAIPLFARFLRPVPMVAIAIILLVGVGAMSISADPDSIFYPVRFAFTMDDADRIDLEIKRVEARFDELAELSLKPTTDLSSLIVAQGKAHEQLEKTQQGIEKLEQNEKEDAALEATTKLKATAKANKKVIERLEGGKATDDVKKQLDQSTEVLGKTVQDLDKKIEDLNTKKKAKVQEEAVSDPTVVDKEVETAKQKVQEAQKLTNEALNGDLLSGDAKKDADAALEALQQAEEALADGDVDAALDLIQDATEFSTDAVASAEKSLRISESLKILLEEEGIAPTPSPTSSVSPSPSPSVTTEPSVTVTPTTSPSTSPASTRSPEPLGTPVASPTPTPTTTTTPIGSNG